VLLSRAWNLGGICGLLLLALACGSRRSAPLPAFALQPDQWTTPPTWVVTAGQFIAGLEDNDPAISRAQTPRDFQLRAKIRITEGMDNINAGVLFDYQPDTQDMWAVSLCPAGGTEYNKEPQIKIYALQDKRALYPFAAPFPIEVNREHLVEMTVIQQRIVVKVDGKPAADFTMPLPRRPGHIGLTHIQASAQFSDLVVTPAPQVE
jgi:hypothetical protein